MSKANGNRGGRRERNVSCWLDQPEAQLLQMALDKEGVQRVQDFVRTAVLDRAAWVLEGEVDLTYDENNRLTLVLKNVSASL